MPSRLVKELPGDCRFTITYGGGTCAVRRRLSKSPTALASPNRGAKVAHSCQPARSLQAVENLNKIDANRRPGEIGRIYCGAEPIRQHRVRADVVCRQSGSSILSG